LQRGIVGDLATLPQLVDQVREHGILDSAGRLAAAARRNGVRVVFCTVERRADGAGSTYNAPLLARGARPDTANGGRLGLVRGTPDVEIVPELGLADEDIVVSRLHGMGPFIGTELDAILRGLGVSTIVAAGVSLNVGIMAMTIGGVDLGYNVIVATDAVAGVPREYGEAVLKHAIPALANRLTTQEIAAIWDQATATSSPAHAGTASGATSD
jgi:nicotinamidase-related amidase